MVRMGHPLFTHPGRCVERAPPGTMPLRRRLRSLYAPLPRDIAARSERRYPALRVLVVDDHPAFRRAVTSALRMVEDVEVVGEAGGGVEGANRAVSGDPDLVLMDLSMPDLDG